MALLGAAGQVRHGHAPRRRQHPPVHGQRGRRLQGVVRVRRPAVHLRRLRGVRRHRPGRLQPLRRPPDHVGAHHPQPATTPRSSSIDPRRTETAGGRHPAPRPAPEVGPHAALRPGPQPDRAGRGRHASSSHDHTAGFAAFAEFVGGVHPRAGRPPRPASPPASSTGSPTLIAGGRAVSFWWTMGVNQSHQGVRTAQALIDLALHDRQHRSARAPGPTRSPASATPWGRGCSPTPRRCSAAATSPTPAHRAEVADDPRTSTRPRIPDGPSLALRPHHRGHQHRPDPQPLGGRHQRRPLVDQPLRPAGAARPARLPRRAGHVRAPPRPPSSPTSCCPPPGGARRTGTFINSERRLGLVQRVVARARRGARRLLHLQGHRRRVGLRRPVPPLDRPRGDVRDPPGAVRRAAVRHDRRRRLRARRQRGGAVAAAPRGGDRPAPAPPPTRAAAVRRRPLLHPGRPGPVRVRGARAARSSGPTARYPLTLLTGRGLGQPVAHRDPHREVGHAAGPRPRRAVGRHPPRRRRRPRHRGRRRRRGVDPRGARCGPGPRSTSTRRRRGTSSCRCTTRRSTGSPSRRSTRTPPAELQVLRRPGPAGGRRPA